MRLHPRNQRFEWTVRPGPFRLVDAAQARSWNERGFFVLEDAFTKEEVARVVAAIDPVDHQVTEFLRGRPDGKVFIAQDGNITFTTHMVKRSPELRAFTHHRVFRDLAFDLIGPDVRLYWDQGVYKKPERPGVFPWHQDNGYTYIEPQQYLTCWVALTDATRENGCPVVAPGLHRRGTLLHEMTEFGWRCLDADPPDAVAAPARAGSIVVFSSLTPHKTGPNLTDAVRKAYIVQFAPEGARAWRDGAEPTLQVAPDHQYPVLVGGAPAAP